MAKASPVSADCSRAWPAKCWIAPRFEAPLPLWVLNLCFWWKSFYSALSCLFQICQSCTVRWWVASDTVWLLVLYALLAVSCRWQWDLPSPGWTILLHFSFPWGQAYVSQPPNYHSGPLLDLVVVHPCASCIREPLTGCSIPCGVLQRPKRAEDSCPWHDSCSWPSSQQEYPADSCSTCCPLGPLDSFLQSCFLPIWLLVCTVTQSTSTPGAGLCVCVWTSRSSWQRVSLAS